MPALIETNAARDYLIKQYVEGQTAAQLAASGALDDAIFAQLGGPGALNASAFVTGTAATEADDRIVYNSATGQLFYDADGSGAGAAVLFATLTGAPLLAASDFIVI